MIQILKLLKDILHPFTISSDFRKVGLLTTVSSLDAITQLDHASILKSFAEEFLFMGDKSRIWGRFEVLQRTANELQISTSEDSNHGKWASAMTLGYTHKIVSSDSVELGLGASVTNDILPAIYRDAYGGNPWTAKIFLQFGGMKMWNF